MELEFSGRGSMDRSPCAVSAVLHILLGAVEADLRKRSRGVSPPACFGAALNHRLHYHCSIRQAARCQSAGLLPLRLAGQLAPCGRAPGGQDRIAVGRTGGGSLPAPHLLPRTRGGHPEDDGHLGPGTSGAGSADFPPPRACWWRTAMAGSSPPRAGGAQDSAPWSSLSVMQLRGDEPPCPLNKQPSTTWVWRRRSDC